MPEFTFSNEYISIVRSNKDVRLSFSIECFSSSTAFIMTIKLKEKMISYGLFVKRHKGRWVTLDDKRHASQYF